MHYINEKIRILSVSVLSLFFLACSLNNATMASSSEEAYSSDSEGSNYSPPSSPEHYSQSDSPTRSEFNEKTITAHIGQLQGGINAFINRPTFQNLQNLAQGIANLVDKAYHSYRGKEKGPELGTLKHTLCKEFMDEIKGHNPHSEFKNVYAEDSPTNNSNQKGGSRLDLVWYVYTASKAYIIDYKFGGDNNKTTPQTQAKYKEALAKGRGGKSKINWKMEMKDIHPNHNR